MSDRDGSRRPNGGAVAAPPNPPSGSIRLDRLTPRELDIMKRLARGWSYQEAADAIGMSRQTLKHHMTFIYMKLEVENAIEGLIACGWLIPPAL